jgi:ribose transport system ATP-binding protein
MELVVEHVTKSFGGTRVLNDVCFEIEGGQVVALLGQNGSGKSTLIKVLTGFHDPDVGSDAAIIVENQRRRLPLSTADGISLRIAAVHQDLGLCTSASVAENLMVTGMKGNPLRPIRWSALHGRAEAMLAMVGVRNISTRALVRNLSAVQQARVAIARAFGEVESGGLLILDEVTAFLTQDGVEELFALIREVAARGTAVLFVSHRLEEIWRICDRAIVLRNGDLVADVDLPATSEEELVVHIVGKRLDWLYPEKHDLLGPPRLHAEFEADGVLGGLVLEARQGEIVGLTGLRGMGYDRVIGALYGDCPGCGGDFQIDRESVDLERLTPERAYDLGCRLVPSERLKNGAVGSATVRENVSLPVLSQFVRSGFLRRKVESEWVQDVIAEYQIIPGDQSAIFESLSGGNQQKVIVAHWLETNPKVLLLDEPVQGVDVGARREIFGRIEEVARLGVTVIYSTSEAKDLAELCHRVLVFRDGKIVGEISGTGINEDAISRMCWAIPVGAG